jgi:hypothetical protein
LEPDEILPTTPDYRRSAGGSDKAFLVANEEIFAPQTFPIQPDSVQAIKAGRLKLYIIGYVDYVDAFGSKFRSGYARVYDPAVDEGVPPAERSNLLYFPAAKYNYDRERLSDE